MPNPVLQVSQRLRTLRKELFGERGQAEFARRLGVSQPRYNRYEKGRLPTADFLCALRKVFKIDINWLLTGVGQKYVSEKPREIGVSFSKEGQGEDKGALALALPLLSDEIAAGPPKVVEGYPAEDYIIVEKKWVLHPKDTLVLKAKGDSMKPTIQEGTFVGIDTRDRKAIEGKIYALRTEKGTVLRRLFVDGDTWIFNPDNPSRKNRPHIFVKPKESLIIGRVVFAFNIM